MGWWDVDKFMTSRPTDHQQYTGSAATLSDALCYPAEGGVARLSCCWADSPLLQDQYRVGGEQQPAGSSKSYEYEWRLVRRTVRHSQGQ